MSTQSTHSYTLLKRCPDGRVISLNMEDEAALREHLEAMWMWRHTAGYSVVAVVSVPNARNQGQNRCDTCSNSLLDILRSDAAGLPITDMLRQSAMLCSGMGGGPLEDRLWLMAGALEPYMSNGKSETSARSDDSSPAPCSESGIYESQNSDEVCDTCSGQEGRHYCLVRTTPVKNMDIMTCDEWAPKIPYRRLDRMERV
jgi:hypothetical protein